jgi:hypothetical protein
MLRIVYVTRKLLAHLSLTLAMKNDGRVVIKKSIYQSSIHYAAITSGERKYV